MTPQRRSTPWSRCQPAAISPITPPSAPASGVGARSASVTWNIQLPAHRRDLRSGEAASDDENTPRLVGDERRKRRRVGAGSDRHDAVQPRLGFVRPRTVAHARSRSAAGRTRRRAHRRGARRCARGRVPSAATPRIHSAFPSSRRRGSRVCSVGAMPVSTCFESGGRSYGSPGSSPMSVNAPWKPSPRRLSAARSPASDAPTMTTRADSLPSVLISPVATPDRRGSPARGRPPPSAARFVLVGRRLGHVHQRFVPVEAERVGRKEAALRVALAEREVHGDPHRPGIVPKSRRRRAASEFRQTCVSVRSRTGTDRETRPLYVPPISRRGAGTTRGGGHRRPSRNGPGGALHSGSNDEQEDDVKRKWLGRGAIVATLVVLLVTLGATAAPHSPDRGPSRSTTTR